MKVDVLIHSARQLVTCAGPAGARRGRAMSDAGLVENGAVALADGVIVAAGATAEVRAAFQGRQEIDASGRVVCPGFVDPHTHAVYAGDRIDEFERRIAGATYLDIMAAGGGIASTVRATRAATLDQLIAESLPRLDAMLALGTTTAEVKTGYGLDTPTELKMLRAIEALDGSRPIDLAPTLLAAHAVPPEYQAAGAGSYVARVITETTPAAAEWFARSPFPARGIPMFVDVFCEQAAFDVPQSRRVLQAGIAAGLRAKAHVDEFTSLGGVGMALDLGAVSVDHLDVTGAADIARIAASSAVAVVIPAVNFNLGSVRFADARGLVDAGAAVALCTDLNPGSAPCPSLPLVMAIACRYQHLSPAEAMTACTINAAHAIGLGDRIGSIEPGKQADMLILAAPDYRHLAYQFGATLVETVVKAGRIYRPIPPRLTAAIP